MPEKLDVLSHRQSTSTHPETDPFGPEIPAVAASAVNLAVGGVVLVGGVQRALAFNAAEAPLVPDAVLAEHLLSGVDGVAATTAALPGGGLGTAVGPGVVVDGGGGSVGAHQGGGVTEPEPFRAEQLAVASPAVDLPVGTVASQNGIKGAVALGAVEALLVPHLKERSDQLTWF